MLFMFSIMVALAATIAWSYKIMTSRLAKVAWSFVLILWLLKHVWVIILILVVWLVWVNRWRLA